MTDDNDKLRIQSDEAEKRLRSVYGMWKAFELLKKQYPGAAILLMDSSASFDALVIDPNEGTLVAVEVKAPRGSSASARRLTESQQFLKSGIESRMSWKLVHRRCVVYGEPEKDAHAEFVK